MTVQDIISGAWGAGGASIIGAFFLLFIRRFLVQYDRKHKAFEDKIESLQGVMTDLKVAIATMTTEISHINKSIDRGNLGHRKS